jgi:hypothetical protein
MSKLTRAIEELARRAAQGDEVARQDIFDEAARLTSQGFPEDTAMRIATGELPMDAASRNARAVEQGYDPFETWYHGTADDIAAFDPAKSQSRDFGHAGKGTYVASHPGIARAYANTAAGSADANIMPLRTSANNPLRISLEEKQALGQAGPSATARLQQQAISEGFDSIEVIMPNGEILEKVIFDPANIRSTNAAFDPANKGKSALLGGLGGAAVVGGTMTPEEAQAGAIMTGVNLAKEVALKNLATRVNKGELSASEARALSSFVNNSVSPDTLIQGGYLNPKNMDPGQIKAATTRYIKALEDNPMLRRREGIGGARGPSSTEFYPADMNDPRIILPEDLLGEILMPNVGDTTQIGVLTKFGGYDLPEGVPSHGGPGFPQQMEELGRPYGWASNQGAANAKVAGFNKVATDTNQQPIAVVTSMGEEAQLFASPYAHAWILKAQELNLPKKQAAKFDAEVRRGVPNKDPKKKAIISPFPEWVGINHPDAKAQLLGGPSPTREGVTYPSVGGRRKSVLLTANKNVEWRNSGLPSLGDLHKGLQINPNETAFEVGRSGYSMYTPEIGVPTEPIDFHQAYDTAIRGKYKGQIEGVTFPGRVMFPDIVKAYTDRGKTEAMAIGGFMANPNIYQKANQQWLDGIRDYLDNLPPVDRDNVIKALPALGVTSAGLAALGIALAPQKAQAGPISSGIKRLASAYEKVASPQAEGVARMVEQGQISPEQADKYTNTIKAYKLFRTKGGNTDELFPLFVNANKPVNMGEWNPAESGLLTDAGKVKSSIGPLAYRPGWHAGDAPVATHIGGKSDSSLKAPDYRPADQVWAEVEMPADVDWQSVADSRMEYSKAGNPIPRTAQITDQIPEGGYYRYKTNPNMTGDWLIAGDMKVNRVLTPSEVYQINAERGVHDLPPVDDNGKMLWSLALGSGLTAAGIAPEEAKAELLSEVPQEQAQQLQDNWSQIEANAQAGMGGMGVRSAPVTQDEEAIIAAQQPAPTGADLMQQANDDFLNSIFNQPGSLLYGADQTNSLLNPDTYNLTYDDIADTSRGAFDATVGFMGDMEQMLIGGIMQGIGEATTWEDALKMIGGGLGQGIINAPEGRGSRFMEGMKNYDPVFVTSKEVGEVPDVVPRLGPKNEGRTKAFEMFGGFFSPI